MEAWKVDLAELKRKDRDCGATKDIIKDCLDRQDHDSRILKWIKKEGAPEPRHKDITHRTGMDQAAYQRAGRWFLESRYFQRWMTVGIEHPAQRVVWLKGTSG